MSFESDPRNTPPSMRSPPPSRQSDPDGSWLQRARAAYRSSTSYVDSNYRKIWEDGIRAFNGQHPSNSKYTAPAYEKRSRIYRPKTRSVIRKNEAAAAAAFFSNVDVVSIAAMDQTSKSQLVSAEVMKQLLQYRLTKSIKWFQTVMGGIQDAQTTGVVCSHIYWDYKAKQVQRPKQEVNEEYPAQKDLPEGTFALAQSQPQEAQAEGMATETYEEVVIIDKPCVELIPVENLRIDPSASWIDPVQTSPYLIHLIPMYVMDVKERMDSGEWHHLSEGMMNAATSTINDTTRLARLKNQEDPLSPSTRPLSDYEIVWVQRHIHRRDGEDWEFYTLSDVEMLSDPVPLKESVFHGERPYVIGCCILETHKNMPSGVPQLSKGLQDEANEIANQRLDNVKFALNKKWFVKRGVDVDIGGLMRNVPGGAVMMNDPDHDVREVTWPDVTQSSYEEQNRINLDMDELLGNFNPAALMMQGSHQNSPARNMAMLSQSNGTLVEYLIRTFVETWVEPVLRQLIKLEQYYETDQTILALAAKKTQLFQKYGIDQVTDHLLNQELTLTVNVGMGATDPSQKLNKFLTAMTAYTTMMKNPVPGLNMMEIGKEIFGNLGYSDGTRFFTVEDPQLAMAQQQLQMAGQKIQQLETQLKEKNTAHVVGLQKTRETNQTKILTTQIQEENENKRALATHARAVLELAHSQKQEKKVTKK